MALLQRLTGIDYLPTMGVPIGSAPFLAMLRERVRGHVTQAQLVNGFGLTADDVDDLQRVVRRVRSDREAWEMPAGEGALALLTEFEDVLLLAEARVAPYTTLAAIRARLIGG